MDAKIINDNKVVIMVNDVEYTITVGNIGRGIKIVRQHVLFDKNVTAPGVLHARDHIHVI